MSTQDGKLGIDEGQPRWSGPNEPQSYTEHQAALDATVFQVANDPYELVLELDSGQLRVSTDHLDRDDR